MLADNQACSVHRHNVQYQHRLASHLASQEKPPCQKNHLQEVLLYFSVWQVNHPCCVKLHAVYVTQRRVYIVTELVSGGELLDR